MEMYVCVWVLWILKKLCDVPGVLMCTERVIMLFSPITPPNDK